LRVGGWNAPATNSASAAGKTHLLKIIFNAVNFVDFKQFFVFDLFCFDICRKSVHSFNSNLI
jgi:hypothetical protein